MRTTALLAAVLTMFIGSAAAAQDAQPAGAGQAPPISKDESQGFLAINAEGTLDRVLSEKAGNGGPFQVQLQAGQNVTNLMVQWSKPLDPKVVYHSDQDAYTSDLTLWKVTAKAPVSSSGDKPSFETLDGLVGGASVGFQLTWTTTSGLRRHIPDAETLNALCPKSDTTPCDLDHHNTSEFADAFFDRKANPHSWIFGANGNVGSQQFAYIDPSTIAKRSVDRTNWNMTGFAAYKPLIDPYMITLTATFQDVFKNAKNQILCPVGGSSMECVDGAVGLPIESKEALAAADFKWTFEKVPVISTAAIDPKVTYDFRTHSSGVDAPIYFIHDSKGALNGGLRFDWASNPKQFTAGVFINQSLQ